MTNPFENDEATYLVLVNAENQHSLWPATIAVPAGWTVVHGEDTRHGCLSYVEDIPAAAMAAGIDWTWETFPEYLTAVERRPKALNHAMYVGHSALRMYVMGRRALTDEATDDEIRAITRLIQEALRAGAVGVSTSRTHTHMTPEGSPVASRQAAWKEVEAIFAAIIPCPSASTISTPAVV